jgi:hypothetical protein
MRWTKQTVDLTFRNRHSKYAPDMIGQVQMLCYDISPVEQHRSDLDLRDWDAAFQSARDGWRPLCVFADP